MKIIKIISNISRSQHFKVFKVYTLITVFCLLLLNKAYATQLCARVFTHHEFTTLQQFKSLHKNEKLSVLMGTSQRKVSYQVFEGTNLRKFPSNRELSIKGFAENMEAVINYAAPEYSHFRFQYKVFTSIEHGEFVGGVLTVIEPVTKDILHQFYFDYNLSILLSSDKNHDEDNLEVPNDLGPVKKASPSIEYHH